jgi:hypothetical protein
MAPVNNASFYSTENDTNGGFEGFTLRSLSLSEPSLPAAATPCNSRMGTPAPAGASKMCCSDQFSSHALIQQADERLHICTCAFCLTHMSVRTATHSDHVCPLIARTDCLVLYSEGGRFGHPQLPPLASLQPPPMHVQQQYATGWGAAADKVCRAGAACLCSGVQQSLA